MAAREPATAAPEKKKSSKVKYAVIGSVIGAAALAYGGAAYLSANSTAGNATVAGVDVSNKDHQGIVDTLNAELAPDKLADLNFRAAGDAAKATGRDAAATVSAADTGLQVDAEATADRLVGFTLDPRVIWERFTESADRAPEVTEDSAKLQASAAGVAEALTVEPVNAGLQFTEDSTKVTPAQAGTTVNPDSVADTIREQWLGGEDIEITPDAAQPEITTERAEEVQKNVAEPAIAEDLELTVTGKTQAGKKLTVSSKAIAESGSFDAKNGDLELTFDADRLSETVMNANDDIGTKAKNASYRIENGKPVVVPSKDGVSVGPDDLVTAVKTALGSADRTADIELSSQPAKFTTQDAEKADMSDIVSEFSTPYSSSPNRDTNLRVASRQVSGTVLLPGEQFSLNDTLGPRTAAAGYKPAGVISGGQMKEDFGGGVSQVSTTLFNAAFFAGFDLDEHKAHSRYISRYPEGRETTLDYTSIDLKFTNNSDTPVVLDMYLSGGKVHARIFGVKTVEVEAGASGRFAYTSPGTVKESGPKCKPQSPSQGWSITIYRTIKDAKNGNVIKKDDFTTVYRPVNRVECS